MTSTVRTVRLVNGRPAVIVKVEYNMTRSQLVECLAAAYANHPVSALPTRMSRAAIVEKIKSELWLNGAMNADVEWSDGVQAWAEKMIDRAYGGPLARTPR